MLGACPCLEWYKNSGVRAGRDIKVEFYSDAILVSLIKLQYKCRPDWSILRE